MGDTKTCSIRICQDGHANALALNRECTQIAVAGRSLLKVFSIENDGFTEVCNMRGGKNQNLSYSSNDVAWSSLDTNILATAATNGVVSVWDLSKFGRQKQLLVYNEHERTAHSVAFHGTEANFLISGSQDGTIKCFDLRMDKTAINTYFSNSESVRDVKFSPHAPNTFAAVSENGTVQLWDIRRTDRCTAQFTAHSGPIYTCDWHPNQSWLATGSRDKQIKVWNTNPKNSSLETTKNVSLEYTVHTIAVVGRVRWRPDKMYHIASCALVVDNSIYIWDLRRPYIPYASFNEHSNVTTGIAFKGNDRHVLLSTSKDSTIFKHVFKDAKRPALQSNPQGANFNYKGDLLYAYEMKLIPPPAPSSLLSQGTALLGARQKTPPSADQFHLARSNLTNFLTKSLGVNEKDVTKTTLLKDYHALKGCAKEYMLTGSSLTEICSHNASVAKKYGKSNVSFLWNFISQLYAYSSIANVKLEQRNSNISQHNIGRLMAQHSNQSSTGRSEDRVLGSGSNPSLGTTHAVSNNSTDDFLEFSNSKNPVESHGLGQILSVDIDPGKCEFVFGETELTFDSVDCIKGFRDGFLYTGPHDLVKDYTFPTSNLMNAHELHHTHPRKHLVTEKSQETSPPPNPAPSFLKISDHNPTPSIWEPHQVLADCLTLQTEVGDVQTSSCILMALGERRHSLQIDECVQENWLLSYIELLHRHQLWNEATQVINLSWIRSVSELNQQSTTMYTNCGQCSKQLLNSVGWYCSRCKSAQSSKCSVCNGVVRGLYAWCQGCSHGGHLDHLKHWFANNSKCPKCGHLCEYE
ncbi:GATOR complex protein WDR24 [Anopheles ziemanni]|uniref:GATOR complex protein WDR24 n=1 Tax=Anopheles coustani TaxID=139045 RepID=UPI00265A9304|nr:GATOR complex protein WDR24 [Anopheles coustani]XP_058171750.1 GATOR complex protein WDR24 [Anopheles ziemanni]